MKLSAGTPKQLRDSSPERRALFIMLEAYWGRGDGEAPPAFIVEAAKLCGFPLGSVKRSLGSVKRRIIS